MKKKVLLPLFILSLIFMAFSPNVQDKWEKLGSRKVDYGLDKDVIQVGAHEGAFTKLKIQVMGGALNMHKVVVEYGNGTKDELEVKQNFDKNSGTRVIDLEGNKRIIKDITFWYDTKNAAKGKATVIVFGKH